MSNPKYVVIGAGNAGAIGLAKMIAQGHDAILMSPEEFNNNSSGHTLSKILVTDSTMNDVIPSSKEFNEKCLNFKSITTFEHKSKFHK